MNCVNCNREETETSLDKCPICFKRVCEACSVRQYGRTFCSRRCADQFFFGDDDE
jgi:hypothetical protein